MWVNVSVSVALQQISPGRALTLAQHWWDGSRPHFQWDQKTDVWMEIIGLNRKYNLLNTNNDSSCHNQNVCYRVILFPSICSSCLTKGHRCWSLSQKLQAECGGSPCKVHQSQAPTLTHTHILRKNLESPSTHESCLRTVGGRRGKPTHAQKEHTTWPTAFSTIVEEATSNIEDNQLSLDCSSKSSIIRFRSLLIKYDKTWAVKRFSVWTKTTDAGFPLQCWDSFMYIYWVLQIH